MVLTNAAPRLPADTVIAVTAPLAESVVRAEDRCFVLHSWSAQAEIDPLPIARVGRGVALLGLHRKALPRLLVSAHQHQHRYQHPKLVAAIKAQADRLCMISPVFANDVRGRAARLIVERAPENMDKVFFTNGGAEANENAIRMARLHTGRHKILAAYRSYHGATAGAIALTGDPRRWPSESVAPGIARYRGPYPYRTAFHSTSDAEESERALQRLSDTIAVEGPSTIAAIILETVVGTNGILVPPARLLCWRTRTLRSALHCHDRGRSDVRIWSLR